MAIEHQSILFDNIKTMVRTNHTANYVFFFFFQPPRFSFYDATKPIYTSRRNLPPSAIDNSKVQDTDPRLQS